jgi:mannose-6-phosphate isomerase
VWGKTELSPWYPDAEKPIGESWFLADHELPLLVKWIFTSDRLSVQLHPDDGEDGPRGKTEMWHILDAKPGAAIALGFHEPITRERLSESVRTGEIERLLKWFPVKEGETYFVPAHTVHAIGAGIVLCEIQQNSDTTYRLWDYGRPRELHVEKALPIADLGVHPGASVPREVGACQREVVRCKHFITEMVHLKEGDSFIPSPEKSQLWICLSGSGGIADEGYQPGEVWLLPETGDQPPIAPDYDSDFLRTWTP